MLTTSIYGYQHNPPAISFMGKKTWKPGKSLQIFLTQTFGVTPAAQRTTVEKIGDAMTEVAPHIRQAMRDVPTFQTIGARILNAWQNGLEMLRNSHHYSLPTWQPTDAFQDLSPLPKLQTEEQTLGRGQSC